MAVEPQPISASLDALTCELIGLCLDSLATGEELMPTLAYATKDDEALCFSFDDASAEECLADAREYVRNLGREVIAYAIAYDGFVQIDGPEPTVSLLVEFGERGSNTAFSAYVPYVCGKTEEDFVAGEPLAAGEEELLLT